LFKFYLDLKKFSEINNFRKNGNLDFKSGKKKCKKIYIEKSVIIFFRFLKEQFNLEIFLSSRQKRILNIYENVLIFIMSFSFEFNGFLDKL